MGLRKIIYLIGSVTFLSLNGQSKDYQEEVHISLNTSNILVGETLYFSAFVYSNSSKSISNLSSILYVELIDESGRPIYQTKVGLRKGRGSGSIYLNSTWISGTYRLVAYTRWMKNYGSFFEQKILIFNPYNNGIVQGESILGNPSKIEEYPVTDLGSFTPLEDISINLGSLEPSTISIAINKAKSLHYSNEVILENEPARLESFEILPEFRYGLVQGKIEKSAGSLDQVRVNMTLEGTSMQVATTKTDTMGRFWISYNPDHSTSNTEVQIQIEEDSVEQITILSEFYDSYVPLDSTYVIMDSVSATELVSRSVQSQIQRAYEKQEQSWSSERQVFTQSNAEVFYLDDYKRFPSVRDTFIELIKYVGVSKSDDNYRMIVRCIIPPGLESANKSPLILLDGIQVTAKDILNQTPGDIEKIEIIPSYYFVKDLKYKGVISVHTFGRKELDFKSTGRKFQLANYQPYSNKAYALVIDSKLPHYESDLYWKPIHTHDAGPLTLDFSTSRLPGTYNISVSGITKTGKAVNLTKYFRVMDAEN